MKNEIIDSFTWPLRWLAAHVMAMVAPDFLDLVVEETPLVVRRTVEIAMDDVGLDATGQQFYDALCVRIDKLCAARPEEGRLLAAYAAVEGLKARDAMWRYEVDVALQRRLGPEADEETVDQAERLEQSTAAQAA